MTVEAEKIADAYRDPAQSLMSQFFTCQLRAKTDVDKLWFSLMTTFGVYSCDITTCACVMYLHVVLVLDVIRVEFLKALFM